MGIFLAQRLLYKAFALLLVLLAVAALFVLLRADFVAASQIMVYVGGILILLVFSLLFSASTHQKAPPLPYWKLVAGLLTICIGTFVLFGIFNEVNFQTLHPTILPAETSSTQPIQTIRTIGITLFGTQTVAFELMGLFLLVVLAAVAWLLVEKEQ